MKRIASASLALLALADTAHAADIRFPDFHSLASLTLVGAAARSGSALRLVPDSPSQAGAAYATRPVRLGSSGAFTTRFQFRVTTTTVEPSDGLTFFLAQAPINLATESGQQLGYAGVPNSAGIEFDTYFNGPAYGHFDALPNQVALDLDGNVSTYGNPVGSYGQPYGQGSCATAPTGAGCLSNGDIWTATISYDGQLLNVTVQDGNQPSFRVITDYPVQLVPHLHGNTAYVGFTAATGAGFANFDLLDWSFMSEEMVVYSFSGDPHVPGPDGALPASTLVADATGALYGTTLAGGPNLCRASWTSLETCGTVFKLTPPVTPGDAWSETVLADFSQSSGWAPEGGLQLDAGNHVLYGVTQHGGTGCAPKGCGTVYAIDVGNPAPASAETVLHFFNTASEGLYPSSGLLRDGATGALFGTTTAGGRRNGGVAFGLAPPALAGGRWSYALVHRFTGGIFGQTPAGLALAGSNALYGTTSAGGTAGEGVLFQLSPPSILGGEWTEAVLHSFTGGLDDGAVPIAGPALDPAGVLYAATTAGGGNGCGGYGCGTIYRFDTSAGSSSSSDGLIYAFPDVTTGPVLPDSPLVIAPSMGALYGTTSAGGTYGAGTGFKLVPSANPASRWRQGHLSFGGRGDGADPIAGGYVDADGLIYGTTLHGGAHGVGAIFEAMP